METQKQLTNQIVQYRESKKSGKINVVAHTDVYGYITAAVEQTVHDMVTGSEKIQVLSPVTVKKIDETIEILKTIMTDGEANSQENVGTKRLTEQAKQFEKMALEYHNKAEERKKQFGEEIANMEAMRSDIEVVIQKKQQEREEQLKAATEAAQKVADETKTIKKNA
jgi:hypothetical protein